MKKLILALLLLASALHADSLLYTVRLASGKPQERTVTITPGTYMVFDGSGNISLASSLTGSGAALTSLNASNITSGTLDAARYAWGAKAIPSGVVVGTTDTQTLTGKTLTSPTITGWAGATSITTLGTVGTGVWQGTPIASAYMAAATLTVPGAARPADNTDLNNLVNTLRYVTPAGFAYLLGRDQNITGKWTFTNSSLDGGMVAQPLVSVDSRAPMGFWVKKNNANLNAFQIKLSDIFDNTTWTEPTAKTFLWVDNSGVALGAGIGSSAPAAAADVRGNILASGTNNTLPNQAAASGTSVMTRDLVDQWRRSQPAGFKDYPVTAPGGSWVEIAYTNIATPMATLTVAVFSTANNCYGTFQIVASGGGYGATPSIIVLAATATNGVVATKARCRVNGGSSAIDIYIAPTLPCDLVAISNNSPNYSQQSSLPVNPSISGWTVREVPINSSASYSSGITMMQVSGVDAPIPASGTLYIRDNGSGKGQLCVRFPTGAVQVLSTEP